MWCPGGEKELDQTMTPLYFGLANSSNPFTAFVVNRMGGNNSRTVGYFDKMGIISSSLKNVPSLALGSCNLSVLEMTSAHAIFSDLGMYHEPVSILRIEDANGSVIWEATPRIAKVMNDVAAFEILKIMKGVTGVTRPADGKRGGTAQRLRASGRAYQFAGIMAGKTGTTQSNTDGWFIGHTPDLVTGVWVGCDNPQVRFSSTGLGQGANTGLPIWGYYMQKVYADKSIKINRGDFTPPYAGQTTVVECVKVEEPSFGDPDPLGGW
jgi:penicillin-binding protein 1A